MKRRNFLHAASLGSLSLGLPGLINRSSLDKTIREPDTAARNIIFMVSDGMSIGTLQMADLFSQIKNGRPSFWLKLIREAKLRRALMDTASADSYVTDSAAASSAWGGGVRVKNGRLNHGSSNTLYKPILQKFKESGKGVGCVTTVPITHATPAGFCINSKARGEQEEIAKLYLPLKFDVMLGGGLEYFDPKRRKDKQDTFQSFRETGYHVCRSRNDLRKLPSDNKPTLGVFHESGLPYTIDQLQSADLQKNIPTLAEMTSFAIDRMKSQPNGFVLQVEGGKVDWAAHANDTPALLFEQLAFDAAVETAVKFAEEDGQTLVVITTDHGNANPGLIGCSNSIRNFANSLNFKFSHEWILRGLKKKTTESEVIERIQFAQGMAIQQEDARLIAEQIRIVEEEETYNARKLPFALLAKIMERHTSVGWAGNDHSGDFVELCMLGPGSELLAPFVLNTELHNLMLRATGVVKELVAAN